MRIIGLLSSQILCVIVCQIAVFRLPSATAMRVIHRPPSCASRVLRAKQAGVDPRTSALNMTLPAAAAIGRRYTAAVDRCLLLAPRLHAASGRCRSTGHTDGGTDTRPLHRPCTASCAGSVNKRSLSLGGSVAEWLACWTQAQKGPDSNRSRDAVG